VDQHPFVVTSDADGDRLHKGAAVRGAVAGSVVQVPAPETVRAVISDRCLRLGGIQPHEGDHDDEDEEEEDSTEDAGQTAPPQNALLL
jgi:hypothetical protein